MEGGILVVESGGSRSQWVLLLPKTNDFNLVEVWRGSGKGLNPHFGLPNTLDGFFEDANSLNLQPDKIFFLGAGITSAERKTEISDWLNIFFPNSKKIVFDDLEGTAFALSPNAPSFVAILGTGSNLCFFNGTKVTHRVPSLGFVLGDEGSGARLGMRLVKDYYQQQMPANIAQAFELFYTLSLPQTLEKIYRQPQPNAFLASQAIFLAQNLSDNYIQNILKTEFEAFFEVMYRPLIHSINQDYNHQICFCGSIAFHFANILTQIANSYNLKINVIAKGAIDHIIYLLKKDSSSFDIIFEQ